MPFVDIGGVSMHYQLRRAAAEVPTLVFVNSLGTDFRIWDEVADRLAATRPTLPTTSAGRACRISAVAYSMDDHVDDLAGLLDRLGIDDVIICGLSIGGLIAQGFVARRPQAVRALILCDTAAKIGTAEVLERAHRNRRARRHRGDRRFGHGELVHARVPQRQAG